MFAHHDFSYGLAQDVEKIFSLSGQLTVLSNHALNMSDAWKTASLQLPDTAVGDSQFSRHHSLLRQDPKVQ